MISGTITITCDKCGTSFTRNFESTDLAPAEVPSRDAMLTESGYNTLWVEREYILCAACGGGWTVESEKLTKAFQDGAKVFLGVELTPLGK